MGMSFGSFDEYSDLSDFNGRTRLFPLPDVTIYPHVVQPLHVFEERYRELLADAMESDQLITMAVLRSGWEGAEEPLPVERAICVGRVLSNTALPDGRSNILLLGLSRARIRRELPRSKLYREAEIELREDVYSAAGAGDRAMLQQRLLERFKQVLGGQSEMREQFEKLITGAVTLGLLTDMITATLQLPPATRLELLDEIDVDRRAQRLIDAMEPPRLSPYQWEFSDN
ncbi:MAG: LON peptidase substrate-binding domain-containing protein [Planctomycetales bacterium]|nr:LON peptidase substrate-binding domain-containing protein [Planctomycetales bacterium]